MSWTRHKFLSFLVSSSSFTIPQHTVPPSIRTCSTATSPFAFNMPCECQLFQTLFPHYVFKNFYRYLRDPSSFPIYLRLLRNLRAPSMIFSVSYDTTTLCRLQSSLIRWENCPAFTATQEDWHYMAICHSFVFSNEFFLFLSISLSFWNASHFLPFNWTFEFWGRILDFQLKYYPDIQTSTYVCPCIINCKTSYI